MAEVWTRWEGQVVGGAYPLRRFLNASDHSSVFLTESTTEGFLNAAIKLVAADPALTQVQLWQWKTAATFSHPHLIRLLDSGQCEIDGRQMLFVVMEYAEETLSQILPYRALEPAEVRELLVPTLDALAFLHRENWVQGQLKPSNFLVVNEQLKLAADTIRPLGVAAVKAARASIYDPPETGGGEISTAGDVWGLGVTLVEALTQYPPTWLDGTSPPSSANIPRAFAETVRRCLSDNPADRPTIPELQAQTKPIPLAPTSVAPNSVAPTAGMSTAGMSTAGMSTAGTPTAGMPTAGSPGLERGEPARPALQRQAVVTAEPRPYSPSSAPEMPKRGVSPSTIAAVVVVLLAIWGGSRIFHHRSKASQTAEVGSQQTAQASNPVADVSSEQAASGSASRRSAGSAGAAAAAAAGAASAPPATPSSPTATSPSLHEASKTYGPATAASGSDVTHEEIPRVPQSARDTIHGRIKVAVRVTVDGSGKVIHETMDNAGPSRYFNRLATEAARKWNFAPADGPGPREWVVRFEFGRDGTTAHAARPRS